MPSVTLNYYIIFPIQAAGHFLTTPSIPVTQQEYDALQEAYKKAFGHS
jgi:hypothetical protein